MLIGGDVSIKRQFNGDIYLTYSSKSQLHNLLTCVMFGNVGPVVVVSSIHILVNLLYKKRKPFPSS